MGKNSATLPNDSRRTKTTYLRLFVVVNFCSESLFQWADNVSIEQMSKATRAPFTWHHREAYKMNSFSIPSVPFPHYFDNYSLWTLPFALSSFPLLLALCPLIFALLLRSKNNSKTRLIITKWPHLWCHDGSCYVSVKILSLSRPPQLWQQFRFLLMAFCVLRKKRRIMWLYLVFTSEKMKIKHNFNI